MKIKKLLAMVMSMAMVLNLASVALAADAATGGSTGTGDVEYVYNANVFQVVLPTIGGEDEEGNPVKDSTLDFILDPMGVIAETTSKELGADQDESTLFFANVDEDTDEVTYSDTSDAYKIINKSTFGVVITATAEIVNGADAVSVKNGEELVAGADFVARDALADNEGAAIYLALIDGDDNTNYIGENEGADYTATLTINVDVHEDIENRYAVSYVEGTGYSYDLTDEAKELTEDDWADTTATIQMTGACNSDEEWVKLSDITPEVKVTWAVNPGEGVDDFENKNGPSVVNLLDLTVGMTAAIQSVDITVPEGAEIETVTYSIDGGEATELTVGTSGYKMTDDDTMALQKTHIAKIITAEQVVTYTVTFDNDETFVFTVTVKAA